MTFYFNPGYFPARWLSRPRLSLVFTLTWFKPRQGGNFGGTSSGFHCEEGGNVHQKNWKNLDLVTVLELIGWYVARPCSTGPYLMMCVTSPQFTLLVVVKLYILLVVAVDVPPVLIAEEEKIIVEQLNGNEVVVEEK